ncbi:SAM-dependent methyltransferase [Actinoplanes sp. NPDC051343]|uniref:SAM-dependent methyltransferase n=1 Tax=Actinoplanes sp. NPDC051343 TaxID=3363906 RepID=UPI003791DC55
MTAIRPHEPAAPLRPVVAGSLNRSDRVDPIDERQPAPARVRSYALGDLLHHRADRAVWQRVLRVYPEAQHITTAHHAFLGRAVHDLIEAGTRQILHLGSGFPTYGAAHEIAAEFALDLGADPGVRVVYADTDPVVVEHGTFLLTGQPGTRIVEADPRRPAGIVYHPQVIDFLDFAEPVTVLISATPPLPPLPGLVKNSLRELGDALVAGSHLVITHLGPEPVPHRRAHQRQAVRVLAAAGMAAPILSHEQLTALLEHTGFQPLSPGVTTAGDWLPDPDDADLPPVPAALAVIASKAPSGYPPTAATRPALSSQPASPAAASGAAQTPSRRREAADARPVTGRHLTLCRWPAEPSAQSPPA